MFRIKVTDEEIIEASKECPSAAQAAKSLGINVKTYKIYAVRLGIYKTNQGLKGTHKKSQRKYNCNDNAFDILTPEVVYWLGYLSADGSIVKNKIQLNINSKDEDVLENFKHFLNAENPINHHKSHCHYKDEERYFDASTFKVASSKIVQRLLDFGIIQGKKYKDIDFMENIPDEYLTDFIVGFFDGDGSVSPTGGARATISISCNKKLSKSIAKFFKEIDIYYNMKERNRINVFYFTRKDSVAKFRKLYIEASKRYPVLQRKLDKFLEIEEYQAN